ncbi:hypothetical protein RSOLAG1IB_11578 [Rhizoctonia solani AG-1 IB]|uniref:Uncharacterized protein n=1 Tax=Thanatephorus cucumeris (strain AG1-IB / isolate 7/3/14) TaxID=1108050 RepID=A0A0B7F9H6_THACB|nr:hypothetical protein RSOLAG1IB_11578 [Rhizoctonia solani AG-1 IB]
MTISFHLSHSITHCRSLFHLSNTYTNNTCYLYTLSLCPYLVPRTLSNTRNSASLRELLSSDTAVPLLPFESTTLLHSV